MDDRAAGTYSTPDDAGWSEGEAGAAQKRTSRGLPTLFGSVFVAFMIMAVVALAVRSLV